MTYTSAKRTPRTIEYPLSELFESAVYMVKAAGALDFDDTTPHELFDIPANTLIVGIGWRTTERFADSGVQIDPWIGLGDTAQDFKFGILTSAELCSSDRAGFIALNYESTAAMKIDAHYSSGGASTAGSVEFWLQYRPWSNAQRMSKRL